MEEKFILNLYWMLNVFNLARSSIYGGRFFYTKKIRMDSFISFFPKKRVPYMLFWVDVDGCDILLVLGHGKN